MIECIFTLDYEIYGDGTGSLQNLVYEPTNRLAEVFRRHNSRFVVFVEAMEFARIEAHRADPAIETVKRQVRELDRAGFEIGLHVHPWWANARRQNGGWALDYSEYHLCALSPARISAIVSESIGYLRALVDRPDYAPLSFRAGNWLFQPTEPVADILAQAGLRVDSSVFRGGRRYDFGLDYRHVPKGRYTWRFGSNIVTEDPKGGWIEIPIHTELVPFWRMQAGKRMAAGNVFGAAGHSFGWAINRARDFLRFQYPLKLDFCRLTAAQMIAMVGKVIAADRKAPHVHRPLVAIGHSKDLSDLAAVADFLQFLSANGVAVSTFREIYPKLSPAGPHLASVGAV